MSKKFPILLTFKAVDQATASIRAINKKFKKQAQVVNVLSNKYSRLKKEMAGVTRAGKKIGKSMRSTGMGMSLGMTLPLVALGATVISTSANFEKSMNKVKALTRTSGAAQSKDFLRMRNDAKKWGAETEYSASQVADAMGFLGMANFNVDEITSSIKPILDLATATGVSIQRTADITSNIMGAFGVDKSNVADVGHVMDAFALATASSNIDLEMLAETMAATAPIAKRFGMSLEETTAITGFLGNIGIQGSVAGTALKNMITNLAAPASAASGMLKELGIQTMDANGNMLGMTTILSGLGSKMKGMPSGKQLQVLNDIFGKRAMAGGGAMIEEALKMGSDGKNAIERYTESLVKSQGAVGKMAGIMRAGASGSIDKMKSAFEGLAISIGDSGILDMFTTVVDVIASIFSSLSKTSPYLLKFFAIMAMGLAILGPMILMGGMFVTSITAMLPALALLAGSLGIVNFSMLPMLIITAKITLAVMAAIAAFLAIKYALIAVSEYFGLALSPIDTLFWLLKQTLKFSPFGLLLMGVQKFSAAIGLSFKPLDYLLGKLDRVWAMAKSLGVGIMSKIGFDMGDMAEGSPIAPNAENLLKGSTAEVMTGSKIEKTEKFEVTLKDEKGNVRDVIKVSESKKLISLNMGPLMGGV